MLSLFDPWKSQFCTCQQKYSLNVYTGCPHSCIYCYISEYIPNAFNCRVKKDFFKKLSKELKKANKNFVISIANSSDPYPQIENKLQLTRKMLLTLNKENFKFLIITKSDLVVRDIDIFKKSKCAISMTITTLNEKLAKKLEPNAVSPQKRINALKILVKEGISPLIRIDPIIPEVNENCEDLVEELAKIGVKSITSSTFKARQRALNRVVNVFPKVKEFYENGEKFGRTIYLQRKLREQLMKRVKENAEKFGMEFAVCREGLNLNSAKSCDGQHLIED